MNRRRFLAAAAGVALTGGSVWVASEPLSSDGRFPMQVETMDARGSTAGTVRLPADDGVTVVDLFGTWCTPCTKQLPELARLHEEFGGRVSFVSVTNERIGGTLSRADIRQWWHDNSGAWTVGLDPESDVMAALGASGLPYLAVLGPDGSIEWSDSGVVSAETLRPRIETALGGA